MSINEHLGERRHDRTFASPIEPDQRCILPAVRAKNCHQLLQRRLMSVQLRDHRPARYLQAEVLGEPAQEWRIAKRPVASDTAGVKRLLLELLDQ